MAFWAFFVQAALAASEVITPTGAREPSLLESWAQRTNKLQVIFSRERGDAFDEVAAIHSLEPDDYVRISYRADPEEVRQLEIRESMQRILQMENAASRFDVEMKGWEKAHLLDPEQGISGTGESAYTLFDPNERRAASARKKAERLRGQTHALRNLLNLYQSPAYVPKATVFAFVMDGDGILQRWFATIHRIGPNRKLLEVVRIPRRQVMQFNAVSAGAEWIRRRCSRLLENDLMMKTEFQTAFGSSPRAGSRSPDPR